MMGCGSAEDCLVAAWIDLHIDTAFDHLDRLAGHVGCWPFTSLRALQ